MERASTILEPQQVRKLRHTLTMMASCNLDKFNPRCTQSKHCEVKRFLFLRLEL